MSTDLDPRAALAAPPSNPRDLWNAVYLTTGVRIAHGHVCPHHQPPWDWFRDLWFRGLKEALILGPRGGGKSFLLALQTHLRSRWNPRHGTRILGGSLAQSGQIHKGIEEAIMNGCGPFGWSDADSIAETTTQRTRYRNGSVVEILAASPKSVRGPHIPDLNLDEIDEMDPGIREAAVNMAMDRKVKGVRPDGLFGETGEVVSSRIIQTSTWHHPDGNMGRLIERARERNKERPGSAPFYSFCAFEVLERCPESISGPNLELCPECPLVRWCHDVQDGGPPLAKRSNGHYTVRDLAQKAMTLPARVFEADNLCRGPRVEGLYFPGFDDAEGGRHVPRTDARGFNPAEYDPRDNVWVAIDPGVYTGVVLFQTFVRQTPFGALPFVRVFADMLEFNVPAREVAARIVRLTEQRCQGRRDRVVADPAGDQRTPIGPSTLAEYGHGGLHRIERWSKPPGSVVEGLTLIEGFVESAHGIAGILVHPRAVATIKALRGFRRHRNPDGSWSESPEDPQHPHEDIIEALRGGLRVAFPNGRQVFENLGRAPVHLIGR